MNAINMSSEQVIHTRFSIPLFADPSLQREVALRGYAVRPCLTREQTDRLRNGFNELMDLIPDGLPESFWPSGRSADPVVRNFARKQIDAVVPSALKQFFMEEAAFFEGGTFLVKPPGLRTALSPHQDSSHVNEAESFSVYAWIPLSDTTQENGSLHVLPGSHLFGNIHRSLNVPWAFRGKENELAKHMVGLDMKAGEVCFFEGATIHHSPPNTTDQTRLAVNYFIRPNSQQFLHHYIDTDTPHGMVEVYGVSIDFFYNEDFEARPPEKYFLRYEPHARVHSEIADLLGIGTDTL